MGTSGFWKENASIVQRLRPLGDDSCPHGYPHLWKIKKYIETGIYNRNRLGLSPWISDRRLLVGTGTAPATTPHREMEGTTSEKRDARNNYP